MTSVSPQAVVESAIAAGRAKARTGAVDLLIRGALGGALLACATVFALTAKAQTGLGIVGAAVFPAGFAIIVLLGLELVTGSFALIPMAVLAGRARWTDMLRNIGWVILAHLIGALAFGAVYAAVVTHLWTDFSDPVIKAINELAAAKTTGYSAMGPGGLLLAFAKAVLCNWLVTLGVVMALTSKSTGGKIAAMWLPVAMFFALGFEHAVVNMFVIPESMFLGSGLSVAQWLGWNQIPVLLGNFVGGALFTGVALFLTHRAKDTAGDTDAEAVAAPAVAPVPTAAAAPAAATAAPVATTAETHAPTAPEVPGEPTAGVATRR